MDIMDPLMNPVTLGWLNNFWVLGFFFPFSFLSPLKNEGNSAPLEW